MARGVCLASCVFWEHSFRAGCSQPVMERLLVSTTYNLSYVLAFSGSHSRSDSALNCCPLASFTSLRLSPCQFPSSFTDTKILSSKGLNKHEMPPLSSSLPPSLGRTATLPVSQVILACPVSSAHHQLKTSNRGHTPHATPGPDSSDYSNCSSFVSSNFVLFDKGLVRRKGKS
jgi:hypothetical protein